MTKKRAPKQSLVERLVRDQLVESPDRAEKQIRAGLVRVDGAVVDKVGARVGAECVVSVEPGREYVGRGAYKLEAALSASGILVDGAICADVGACTGGFTQVLLQRGAARVFAIDVGYGNLDWKLRSDPRVVVMERTNARYLERLEEQVSIVTIDVSFISLDRIIPVVTQWMAPRGHIIALIKPQFEARREEIAEGGIVVDESVHQRVIDEIKAVIARTGLLIGGLIASPILGSEGNQEFLVWAEKSDYPG